MPVPQAKSSTHTLLYFSDTASASLYFRVTLLQILQLLMHPDVRHASMNLFFFISIIFDFFRSGRFQENGGVQCGYILKPEWMRYDYSSKEDLLPSSFKVVRKRISICVLSAQHLRPQSLIDKSKNETIDPYIEFELKGTPLDDSANKPFRTSVVQDNGFNPRWEKVLGKQE